MLEMRSIDVEAKEAVFGWTCLMTAAGNGHLDICRLLIDKGAQVEAKDTCDVTPLHWAAIKGLIEVVSLLCDYGADIEARTDSGMRPLHYAAYHGNISVVKDLIEVRNADINARDDMGKTPLWWGTRITGYDNKDAAAYLVSHGGIE
jgi:hypothetical protein